MSTRPEFTPTAKKKSTTRNTNSGIRGNPLAKDKQPADGNSPSTQTGGTRSTSKPAKSANVARAQVALSTPLATSQAVNVSANLIEEKDAEIQRLQARIAAMEKPVRAEEEIISIQRPKGEAGDKKKGFILQEAMELDGGSEGRALYASILRSTRHNIVRANLDTSLPFRRQDTEKLLNVYKLTRKEHPYLTRKRFPGDWAIAEIVKQYLRNQRKETKRKLKAAGEGGPRRKRLRHIDDDDSAEDSNGGEGMGGDEGDENGGEDD
ncbi:hypothetical protein H0H93_013811 [Arthromyces matolae]|nr:hypothetical protein H0H93_013811 [Arthromyces matolae]